MAETKDKSLGELFGDLTRETSNLVRQEVRPRTPIFASVISTCAAGKNCRPALNPGAAAQRRKHEYSLECNVCRKKKRAVSTRF